MAETQNTPKQAGRRVEVAQVVELRNAERQKMKILRQRARVTERMYIENLGIEESLKEIGKKKSAETLVKLGGGVLVKATINPSEIFRTLPGNVILPSAVDEVEKDVSERKKLLETEMSALGKEMNSTQMNLNGLNEMLARAKEKMKKK